MCHVPTAQCACDTCWRVVWSDSDDDDTKRVVKSEKEKRFDELCDIIKLSKNYRKIKDMANTLAGEFLLSHIVALALAVVCFIWPKMGAIARFLLANYIC